MQIVLADGTVNPEYRAIRDPRERFKYVSEALLLEQSKSEPDLALMHDYISERNAQRARATMLFPVWDATHNLSVADLEGRTILYSPNPMQVKLHALVEKFRRLGMPLKLLIPKSRRQGTTEGVSKVVYPLSARRENVKSLIVAQADPEAQEIFRDKYKFVHSNDPFAPVTRKCNDTMLDFVETGSQIAVRSAGGRKGVGRGSGHIALHLSECGFYPGDNREQSGLISSLIAGMPKTMVGEGGKARQVFTIVFAESTGNGQKGWFYEKCMRVWNNEQGRVEGEEGSDEDVIGWQLMFLPWWKRWNAILPFVTENEVKTLGVEKAKILDHARKMDFVKTLSEEEVLLQGEYGCSLEQLNWRRDTLLHDIEGATEEERNRMFKQEHPANFVQCFQPAGGMAFPVERVSLLYDKAKDPPWRGRLVSPIKLFNPLTNARIAPTPVPKLLEDKGGWFYKYEDPVPNEEYCIGVDLAKGTIAGDWSTAVVFARHSRRFVAYIRAKLGPDQMVEPVRLLSRLYNDAIINPEENYGAHLIEELKKCDRLHCLYWRHGRRSAAGSQFQRDYGFVTNQYTKKHLVDLTNHLLDNEPGIFVVKPLLQEMLTFEQELTDGGEVKYPGAPPNSGVFDDLLMGGMLALVADYDMRRRGTGPVTNPKGLAGPKRGFTRDLRTRLNAMKEEAPAEGLLEVF